MIIQARRIASVLVIAPPLARPGAEGDRFVACLRRQLSPVHSITSSARSRIGIGNEMPKAFTVLRLTMSSILVTS
jgi:hypothetical protein